MEPLSALAAEATRQDWRELGFFYMSDELGQVWHLHGSRAGLRKFADRLDNYARASHVALNGGHEHLGPHCYLTLTTWLHADVDRTGIRGQACDFERMASLVRDACASIEPGQTSRVREQFATKAAYALILHAHADGFDPAGLDPQLAMSD